MRLNIRAVLLLCTAVLIPVAARAGNCSCTGTTLNVGAYSVFSATASQPTAALSVTCNGNGTYNVGFSTGNSGSYASRRMDQAAGDSLFYNIYTDAARTTVWAATNQKVYTASGSVTFSEQLYMKLNPLQDLKYSGNAYQDFILVTMTPDASTGGPTRTCNITIQSSVTAECLAPGATLAFGTYDPVVVNASAASPLNANTNLAFTCTKGVSATVALDNGLNVSGGVRRLAGPSANFLQYDIYKDSGRTQSWTALAGGTVTAVSTSKNTPLGGGTGLPAYGRIPGNQDVVAGSYSDSVTATINY